jgi:hypothetical protein
MVVTILITGLSGCGLFGIGSGGNSCENLQVSVDQNQSFLVRYALTTSGDASVSSVSYRTDQGEQRVESPTQVSSPSDSWSKSVEISPKTRAVASAQASAESGKVTLRLRATSGGTRLVRETVCGSQSK